MKNIYTKVVLMDKNEQLFVIGICVVTVLILFSPLMILSPNNEGSSSTFVFLMGQKELIKVTFVILTGLFLILNWHLNLKFKNYIVDHIGFDNNHYLLSFFLLFTVLSSTMTIGDTASIFANFTTILSMHTMYYIIQIMLIILLAFSVYMLIHTGQGGFRGHIVGYDKKRPQHKSEEEMDGLFSNIK